MNILKKILLALLALVALLLVIAVFALQISCATEDHHSSRPDAIFPWVNNPHKWPLGLPGQKTGIRA